MISGPSSQHKTLIACQGSYAQQIPKSSSTLITNSRLHSVLLRTLIFQVGPHPEKRSAENSSIHLPWWLYVVGVWNQVTAELTGKMGGGWECRNSVTDEVFSV